MALHDDFNRSTTGAAGILGGKLRAHFNGLRWTVRLLDRSDPGDPAIEVADLAVWDDAWIGRFAGVDLVIHLAGDPSLKASSASVQRQNMDLMLNVLEAAARAAAPGGAYSA